jgi:hypothetical protein
MQYCILLSPVMLKRICSNFKGNMTAFGSVRTMDGFSCLGTGLTHPGPPHGLMSLIIFEARVRYLWHQSVSTPPKLLAPRAESWVPFSSSHGAAVLRPS